MTVERSLHCMKTTKLYWLILIFPGCLYFSHSDFQFIVTLFLLFSVMRPVPWPSASANVSFKTVNKAAVFSCHVTWAVTAVIVFLFLSRAERAEALTSMSHKHWEIVSWLKVRFTLSPLQLSVHRWCLSRQDQEPTTVYWSGRHGRSTRF